MTTIRKILLTFAVSALVIGPSLAVAGGSSDTSGDGSHCYLFFSLPDQKFAQAMVNDSDPDEVSTPGDPVASLRKSYEYLRELDL